MGTQSPEPISPAPTPRAAPGKDTVFIALPVLRGPRHVQQDQLGVLGLVQDDTVELHSRVHPPDIGLVPVKGKSHSAPQPTMLGTRPGLNPDLPPSFS